MATRQAAGQELSPRAYWPAPEGTRVATIGYAYTSGDILTDPSLPVTGVNSDINSLLLSYRQTFNLLGRNATFILEAPYSWGQSSGQSINNQRLYRDFAGLGDLATTISVNLLGAPNLDGAAFQALRADPRPLLGVSLRVVAPTGKYHDDRVVNTSANRWAAKLEFGTTLPIAPKWLFEAELGAWWFDDNEDFVFGVKEQDTIYAVETHLVHRFNPGFWASLDLNYYRGGRTTVDGVKLDDLQRSSKIGGTVAFPLENKRVLRIGYSWGSVSDSSQDYSALVLTLSQLL